jgi:hypothetical protein
VCADRGVTAGGGKLPDTPTPEGSAVKHAKRSGRPIGPVRAASLSRRGFLGLASAAGVVVAIGAFRPARTGALSASEQAMIVQLARAGAVFPIDFPGFGEPGPAIARATTARLSGTMRRTSSSRLKLAASGARLLIARRLLDQPQPVLLDGIGRLAGRAETAPELAAAVALAIATVSRHFSPDSNEAAEVWLDGLRRVAERPAQRPGALAGRGA